MSEMYKLVQFAESTRHRGTVPQSARYCNTMYSETFIYLSKFLFDPLFELTTSQNDVLCWQCNVLQQPHINSGEKVVTHGGTRTPNLRFRRPTPYPLGHAGW